MWSGAADVKKVYQTGIGLPAAIFVITLMAIIAVAVNQLVSQNAQTFEEEINLTRAFYAAESGAGIAMNTVFPPDLHPTYANANPRECIATDRVYTFIADGLNQCSATVSCTPVTIGTVTYATIQSKGLCADVERTVQVRTVY